jgi:hypothetical protein
VKKDRVWQLKIQNDSSTINTQYSNISNNQNKLSHSHGRRLGSHHPNVKIKLESDLSAAERDLVIIEYCEERLPLQMAKGTGSKIINYDRGDKSRCPISAGGGDRPPKVKRSGGDSNHDNLFALKMEKPRFDAINDTFDAAQLLTH